MIQLRVWVAKKKKGMKFGICNATNDMGLIGEHAFVARFVHVLYSKCVCNAHPPPPTGCHLWLRRALGVTVRHGSVVLRCISRNCQRRSFNEAVLKVVQLVAVLVSSSLSSRQATKRKKTFCVSVSLLTRVIGRVSKFLAATFTDVE